MYGADRLLEAIVVLRRTLARMHQSFEPQFPLGRESCIFMGMTQDLSRPGVRPGGEQPLIAGEGSPLSIVLDSFAGAVRVEWDQRAAFTPLGQLPFFIDFLKTAGLFEAFSRIAR